MATMGNNPLAKLVQAAREDPAKATVLAALVLIMLIMWGRLALTGRNEPAAASAMIDGGAGAGAAVASPAPASLLRSGLSDHAERLSEWTRQPVRPLARNLFAVNLTYYRRADSNVRRDDGEMGFWEELAKSRAAKTDQKKARQILIENLQLQAAQIRLQSTVMGAQPKAMVNGKLVGEGDVVAVETADAKTTFRVIKIEARGMIVEHEGIRLAISMK